MRAMLPANKVNMKFALNCRSRKQIQQQTELKNSVKDVIFVDQFKFHKLCVYHSNAMVNIHYIM